MPRWTFFDSTDLGRVFVLVAAGFGRGCRDAEMFQQVWGSGCFDPEDGPVASVVFAGADDVVTAPPSGLSGQ